MIEQGFAMATDRQFNEVGNFASPPRAGKVTDVLPSGQVQIETDDPEQPIVTAWPLNGFTYAVGDVVYVAFAVNNAESAIVIGSKSPLPVLDPSVFVPGVVLEDGSVALTADWDIGEDMGIRAERFEARDAEGLRLEDDGGNLGILIADGGEVTAEVGIRPGSGSDLLDVYEEGTWTPAITGSSSNPTVSYTTQVGQYTRVGNRVDYQFLVTINTISGGGGDMRISLPFTVNVTGGCPAANGYAGVDIPGTPITTEFRAAPSQAWGRLVANQDNAAQQITQISGLANGDAILVQGVFFV